MSRANNVRGPTSALTEFLREQGINATSIARRARTREQPQEGQPDAGSSTQRVRPPVPAFDEEPAEAGPSTTRRGRAEQAATEVAGDDSDHLDEEEEEQPKKKKRKMTKAQEAKAKAAAKKAAEKKKKQAGEDDSDDENYNAPSRSAGANGAKPLPGNFADCAKCSKQFTVTIYTVNASDGSGLLCHTCAKASGQNPFQKAKPSKPVARKREARQVVNFEERHFPSLVSVCIDIVSKHINDVEAIGSLTSSNTSDIAKAICKNRTLSPENAMLFYDVSNTNLHFTDATMLTPDALITLGSLNPNLVSLRLDYCGRINNKVFEAWSTSLSSLKRIELLGPFLVRTEAWQSFFAANPQLEGFLITQSPRFDIACMKALSKHCVNLHELRLKEVGKLDDAFVDAIQEMNPPVGWTLLDLSDPSKSLSEKALIQLFSAVGPSVKRLDLSGHHDFTDTVLTEGLQANTSSLTHLRLSNILNITDEGVANFFTNYKNAPLREIDLSRNAELGVEPSLALDALLAHSGPSLRALNINGWREVPEPSLSNIGKLCPKLERLDVGWCREADDFVIKNVLDGCAALKEVKVWACNRLTVNCPRRRGVNMIGVEIAGAS